MQINNFQRIVENLNINDDNLIKNIQSLVAELEDKQDEATVSELIIKLAKLASKGGIELETTLLKKLDEMKRTG